MLDKRTSVLTKVASVNKSRDVTNDQAIEVGSRRLKFRDMKDITGRPNSTRGLC